MQSRVKGVDSRGGGDAWRGGASGTAAGVVGIGLMSAQGKTAGEYGTGQIGEVVESFNSATGYSILLIWQQLSKKAKSVEIVKPCAELVDTVLKERSESNQPARS